MTHNPNNQDCNHDLYVKDNNKVISFPPCTCSEATPTPETSWEERFDSLSKEFWYGWSPDHYGTQLEDEVKAFISKEIENARTALLEEIGGEVEELRAEEWGGCFGIAVKRDWAKPYNEALDYVLRRLDSLKAHTPK